MENFQKIRLGAVNSGADAELFEEAFEKMLENIRDPNFQLQAKRSITVNYAFAPSRDAHGNIRLEITVSVDGKTPKREAHTQTAWITNDGVVQTEDPNAAQLRLDEGIANISERSA